ncbi:hypothetical protein [Pseudoxanthomonas sp. 10H]|uniref:hypothetical protein n=1 Tax=Pseudoxanthomonas sp. 10H TaxID=3242729 RepID=UPI0035565EB6
MTTAHDHHESLDRHARQLHASALANVSAPTLARLRAARRDAATSRPWPGLAPWLAGGAMAAAVAVAVLVQPGAPTTSPAAGTTAPVVATAGPAPATEPVEPLQDDPGFYVWLASVDATALAME